MTSAIPSPSVNTGRAAIVTGAAQGMGRAIALRLARDGYAVALNDLASKSAELDAAVAEIRAAGRKAIAVAGDVAQEQDVQTLVDRAVAELGELHVMVANAGIGSPSTMITELSLDLWSDILSVNLTGVFLCYRAAARQMLKQGHGGRIIGASSSFGKRGSAAHSAYSSSKFGVRGLTQALASELAKEGITVNAYAPGLIDTPLTHEIVEEFNNINGVGTLGRMTKDMTPMGRYGTPEDVAGLVSYIASDEADFTTGQTVSLNGGIFYD